MNTLLGLLIIAVGSFCQSSSYVPIKKVKEWSWESFWLVQGIFAWLVFPLLGALLAVPAGSSLGEILSTDPSAAFKAAGYGVLWGVGGLTFATSGWRSGSRSPWAPAPGSAPSSPPSSRAKTSLRAKGSYCCWASRLRWRASR